MCVSVEDVGLKSPGTKANTGEEIVHGVFTALSPGGGSVPVCHTTPCLLQGYSSTHPGVTIQGHSVQAKPGGGG